MKVSSLSQQVQKAADALRHGRFSSALKLARVGLKAFPAQVQLANLAGLACAQSGDARGAASYFELAMRADPGHREARHNLAQALMQLGAPDKALTVLAAACDKWPTDVGLLLLRARAMQQAGDDQSAVAAATDAIALAPGSGALFYLRALAYVALGDSRAADADFQQAVALAPQDAANRIAFADFLAHHARSDEAVAQIDAGLAAHPDHAGLLQQAARLAQASGDITSAVAQYERLLNLIPDHPLALNGLAYICDTAAAPALLDRLQRVGADKKTAGETKVLLGFARAALAARVKATDAPQLLARANAAAARLLPYDGKAEIAAQDRLLAPFVARAATAQAPRQENDSTAAPIFILGLIRSGTTLAEQVLASHPQVAGLGELSRARQLADTQATAFADAGTAPDARAFAEAYRAVLPPLPDGTQHFVDKMPDNFRVIGYLLNAFPDATIIEMQRDPRDVALSMWADLFPTSAHAYANDLTAMAQHMNTYADTMQRWRNLYPTQVHAVAYADLVTDLEATARQLADLCGLGWHPDMLHPERTAASILTASAQQVRAPVHRQSLGKWRDKAEFLTPLTDALDPALWPGLQQG
tara:strand:- start:24609 stop:26381 length:1773 start_codon:yes stop_codon:yes gene_type:complete